MTFLKIKPPPNLIIRLPFKVIVSLTTTLPPESMIQSPFNGGIESSPVKLAVATSLFIKQINNIFEKISRVVINNELILFFNL